jgi:hypothetical protein
MSGWRREGSRITASPDLNTLFPASSNLHATMANEINDKGQISGMAVVLSGPHAGDIHAFLALQDCQPTAAQKPETSQGGVREAAIARTGTLSPGQSARGSAVILIEQQH